MRWASDRSSRVFRSGVGDFIRGDESQRFSAAAAALAPCVAHSAHLRRRTRFLIGCVRRGTRRAPRTCTTDSHRFFTRTSWPITRRYALYRFHCVSVCHGPILLISRHILKSPVQYISVIQNFTNCAAVYCTLIAIVFITHSLVAYLRSRRLHCACAISLRTRAGPLRQLADKPGSCRYCPCIRPILWVHL